MKVSAKTEYACIAMLELAEQYQAGEPVRIRSIAERHGVPAHFLVQILLQLKAAGLVTSVRGAGGGYKLIQPPEDISLGAVMAVIDGADEKLTSSASADSPAACVLQDAWQEVCGVERAMLDSINFAELIDRAVIRSSQMYYI